MWELDKVFMIWSHILENNEGITCPQWRKLINPPKLDQEQVEKDQKNTLTGDQIANLFS